MQTQKLTYFKLTYFFKLVNFKFPEFCVFAKDFLALSGRKMKEMRTKVDRESNVTVKDSFLLLSIMTLTKVTYFANHQPGK